MSKSFGYKLPVYSMHSGATTNGCG